MSSGLGIAFLLFALRTAARLVNVTIDDTYGDERTSAMPQYSPSDTTWAAYHGNNSCPKCVHLPNSDQTHNNTWHSNTVNKDGQSATISLSFSGSAIRVFFFLVNEQESSPQSTHMLFSLDNGLATAFDYQPHNNAQGYLYDVPVYVNSAISGSGPHTLLIQQAGSSTQPSIAFFDYAMYEMDDLQHATDSGSGSSITAPPSQGTVRPTSSSSHKMSLGAAAGIGALATAIVITFIAIVILVILRRSRRTTTSKQRGTALESGVTHPTTIHVMSDGLGGPGDRSNGGAMYSPVLLLPNHSSMPSSSSSILNLTSLASNTQGQSDEATGHSPPPYQVGSPPRTRKGVVA